MKRKAIVGLVLDALFLMSAFPIGYTQLPGLVGYWKFDEGSGGTVSDSSGNGNNGAVNGASWISGKVGSALSFDGVDDYVDCGTGSSLMPTAAITVEAWFSANSVSTYGTIASTFFYEGYFLRINPNAGIEFAPGICYSPPGTIQPGVWYHVAGTFDGTLAQIYVNAQLVGSQRSGYLAYTGQSLRIGNNPIADSWFNGIIDEVKIYNRALSAADILAEYTAQPTQPLYAMKTKVSGQFYVPTVPSTPSQLKIEMLFSDQNLVGDQLDGKSPYTTIKTWPNGIVIITDVAYIAKRFATTPGGPNWDYMADVDGIAPPMITILDITLAARSFGRGGTYIPWSSALASTVTVVFNTGPIGIPTANGNVPIAAGQSSFTVLQSGTPIGALVTFW